MGRTRFTPVRAGIFAQNAHLLIYSLKLQNQEFGIISIDIHVSKAYANSSDPYFKYAKITKSTSSFYRETDLITAITVEEFMDMLKEAETVFALDDYDVKYQKSKHHVSFNPKRL